ncbi:unnamed protein product [Rhodiola kirilowii]
MKPFFVKNYCQAHGRRPSFSYAHLLLYAAMQGKRPKDGARI